MIPFPLSSRGLNCIPPVAELGNFGLGMMQWALVLVGKDGRIFWRRTDLPICRRSADEFREVIEGPGIASGGAD